MGGLLLPVNGYLHLGHHRGKDQIHDAVDHHDHQDQDGQRNHNQHRDTSMSVLVVWLMDLMVAHSGLHTRPWL